PRQTTGGVFMANRTRVEARVGIFVFISLVILVYFLMRIGDFDIFRSGYNLKVFFGFANGIKVSAPVRVAGVDAGEVRSINVFFDPQENKTRVEISFWVRETTRIPVDSKVMINTLGLLGEKYLEILPGVDYSNLFKDGDVLTGNDPVPMEEIGDLGRRVVVKLEESIDSLNGLINDKDMHAHIKQAVDNFSRISQQMDDMLTAINNSRGTVGKFIYDASIYDDMQAMIKDLRDHPWKLLYRGKDKRRRTENRRQRK
ncbi:MAG: MlaD family protein, partial [Candidatus Omnitrophota bacterium]